MNVLRCISRSQSNRYKLNYLFSNKYLQGCISTTSIVYDTTEIKMPSLSPTMTEGTIIKWLKKEGDPIQPGDVLCDIQTDKAVISMEIEEEGIMAKILFPENTENIKVGQNIALMVGPDEDWKSATIPIGTSVNPESDESLQKVAESSQGSVPAMEVKMPSLSPTMTAGTIVKWLKNEGDTINPGDILCDIQTDKAVVSFEMEEEGILAKILVPENTMDVEVGSNIALIVEPGADWRDVKVENKLSAPPVVESVSKSVHKADAQLAQVHEHGLGPAARSLLEQYGLSASTIPATGPKGLVKGDILKYVKANNMKPLVLTAAPEAVKPAPKQAKPVPIVAPTGTYTDIPLTSMRSIIAKRLLESKTQIPHAYMSCDSDLDNVLRLRKDMKKEGINVSLNDFVIKAAAVALKMTPEVNVLYKNGVVQTCQNVDISVAVATDAGLITPIVFNAINRSVQEISATMKSLGERAKANKLKPEEFQGGTFTISNLGMFGIKEFSAIINPPQCAILAVGGGRKVFVDEELNIVTKMRTTLSYDARAISEDEAAKFMELFSTVLSNPHMLNLAQEKNRVAL